MNNRPIIIAEACQNHKGDLEILKDMIAAAKEAGADIIKIQSMLASELTQREDFEQGVLEGQKTKAIKRPFQPEYDRLKPMDLDDAAHQWFINECERVGIEPMTTLFTPSRLPFVSSLDWNSIKVASYDCASVPFLEELKKHFKHLYISTGATFDEEIEQTARILKGCSYTFLHCVTIYPTPLSEAHLKRMDWLRRFTPSVGFSDHSLISRDGNKSSLAALYYGADVIERHFTVLQPDQTKDGPVSVNPHQLKELVDFARLSKEDQAEYVKEHIPEYAQMLGQEQRPLSDQELLNRNYYRGRFAQKVNGKTVYNWQKEVNL